MTKRFVIVENGCVQNVAVSDEALAENWHAHESAQIGWHFDGNAFTAPPEIDRTETLAMLARRRRDTLLAASDWTQVVDSPVNQAAWAIYRQQLRDLPLQSDFPIELVWPTAPTT